MKRLFIQNLEIGKQKLDSPTLRYLTKTLRFKGEEEIKVFDGENEALATFQPPNAIDIKKIIATQKDIPLKLAIAEIQKERLEWAIEKACELGTTEIIILKTARTQKFYNFERLEKIAIAASQQCKRISIAKIHSNNLIDFLKITKKEEWIYGSLKTSNHIMKSKTVGAIIGPEGGWSEEEENALTKKSTPFYLNKNILRTETAAIVSLSLIAQCRINHKKI